MRGQLRSLPGRVRSALTFRRVLLGTLTSMALLLGALAAPGIAEAYRVTGEPRACTSRQVRVGLAPVGDPAGAGTFRLTFTNLSKTRCQLAGVPELEFQDAGGRPVAKATHDQRPGVPAKVTLGAGGTASGRLVLPAPRRQECLPAAVARLVVRPALHGHTWLRRIPFRHTVCTGRADPPRIEPIADAPVAARGHHHRETGSAA